MRLILTTATRAALLGLAVLLGSPGMADDTRHSGWYVGAGVGLGWMAEIKQAGWNRDSICYPDDDCSHKASIGGYRWFYDHDADRGSVFEFAVGRVWGALRLELSATRRENDLGREFTGISYLDGTPILPDTTSGYTSQSVDLIDRLRTEGLQLNAYYDFPRAYARLTPYLGAGIGFPVSSSTGWCTEASTAAITAAMPTHLRLEPIIPGRTWICATPSFPHTCMPGPTTALRSTCSWASS
ncbi:MAG: hypothetical protein F4X93_01275 [Proteobacteria bacterium]|nr:hypothetical protein [Pseudomonadota bacterium]